MCLLTTDFEGDTNKKRNVVHLEQQDAVFCVISKLLTNLPFSLQG